MPPLIDITGQRYGRLTVISRDDNARDGKTRWRCQCDCGQESVVLGYALKNGESRSCGCLQRERAAQAHKTHGGRYHDLYNTWCKMRRRCNNLNDKDYHHYGGRGIKVDSRWDDFAQFVADMGEKPGLEYSIDRIDNDGPYSPENCQWATPKEQRANQRV